MIAMGFMANKEEMGIEASGIVRRCGTGVTEFKKGDRIMIMQPGLFRTRVIVSASRCVHVRPSISLEEAASMSVVYGTALYCIMDIGRLEKGQVSRMPITLLLTNVSLVCFDSRSMWRSRPCCNSTLSDDWGKGKR